MVRREASEWVVELIVWVGGGAKAGRTVVKNVRRAGREGIREVSAVVFAASCRGKGTRT
jgi:hypothetical protein